MLYTRFNYTTGDAAGQNLTGKATQEACRWIVEHYPCESSPRSWPRPCCAGELSLGSAIVAGDWVQAHDLFGRNRP